MKSYTITHLQAGLRADSQTVVSTLEADRHTTVDGVLTLYGTTGMVLAAWSPTGWLAMTVEEAQR